jgi:hypothetical protein
LGILAIDDTSHNSVNNTINNSKNKDFWSPPVPLKTPLFDVENHGQRGFGKRIGRSEQNVKKEKKARSGQ